MVVAPLSSVYLTTFVTYDTVEQSPNNSAPEGQLFTEALGRGGRIVTLIEDRGLCALSVRALTVRYGGFTAVSEVDLDVPVGEVVGLIGPNGAGKTTCFNAIGGYLKPYAGSVIVNGVQMTKSNPRAAWRAGIGRTFQRLELFWTLTVTDHIELARRLALKERRTPPSTAAIIKILGLSGLEDRVVATLSLGSNRLVELARAIATGSSLILMDEPCSGLDHVETATLQTALTHMRTELNLSLLIVEHDMDFILTIADTILVLNYGRMIAKGTPQEIRASEEVRRAYLGDAAAETAKRAVKAVEAVPS